MNNNFFFELATTSRAASTILPCSTAHARGRQIRPLPLSTWAPTRPRTTDGPPPARAPLFVLFVLRVPFTLATGAPTRRRMSLENRPWTAPTPVAQTASQRNDDLASAGSRRTDRSSAEDHAGGKHSLQDRSLGAPSVGSNMTGHGVEAEGRPPYMHVSTQFSRLLRTGRLAWPRSAQTRTDLPRIAGHVRGRHRR